jgi:hypothetical protein
LFKGEAAILADSQNGDIIVLSKAFSFFLSLNAKSLFQDLTSLRGGPKTASGKESLSSSHKRCSGQGTPWSHPKAGDATS